MAQADLVVPTWNGRGLLERCLPTLVAQAGVARLVVVDNGSTDGTAEMLAERFPSVAVVALAENRGFARAVNAGVAAGAAKHVVLVNNDVECDPGFVAALSGGLRGRPPPPAGGGGRLPS